MIMKSLIYFALTASIITFATAKSKYGDYYLGFGIDFIEAGDSVSYDGEGLSLFANSLASDEASSLARLFANKLKPSPS